MIMALVNICIVALLVAGCADVDQQERRARGRQVIDYWNSQVGALTYDQALTQLGPPSSVAEGKEVTVAVWQSAPGPTLLVPMPPVGFGQTYLAGQAPSRGLALTFSQSFFDPDQKVLRSWRSW